MTPASPHRYLPLLALLLTLTTAAGAGAQRPQQPQHPANAVADFKEATRLYARGEIPAACHLFQQSLEEDPAPGTLFNLASCHERAGRLGDAFREFTKLARRADDDRMPDKAAVARARADALVPKLSRLTLVHRVDARADVTGLTLDGNTLGADAWRAPVYVEPGAHVLVAQHSDGVAITRDLSGLKAGATSVVELENPASPVATPPAVSAPSPSPATPALAPSSGETPHPGRRVASYVVGGAGLAVVAVASYFGARAISKRSEMNDDCPGQVCRLPETVADALSVRGEAKVDGTLSTVGFISGGAALVAAGILFFTSTASAPEGRGTSARALQVLPTGDAHGAGMALGAQF